MNPIVLRGVYDEAKRFAEALTMAYHRRHGMKTRIVRIFNTIGDRMRLDDGRAVPTFASQALRGEPLTVQGGGSQTRSIGSIDDLVDGIVTLLGSDYAYPVNLGNPGEVTVLALARMILRITGSSSQIRFVERPQDDPNVRRPDIRRARTILGWEPKVDLEGALRSAVGWMASELELAGPPAARAGSEGQLPD